MMNDEAVTSRFRVIAFDLPWHGKSYPPEGWQDENTSSPQTCTWKPSWRSAPRWI